MGGEPQKIDRDQDGTISRTELQMHVLAYGRARTPVPLLSPIETPTLTQAPGQSDPIAPLEGSASAPQSTGDAAVGVETHEARLPARTTRFTVRPSRGLGNLPGWFLSRDADGDGQLTLREYVGDSAGNRREFDLLDGNGDGVVTPREAAAPRTADQPANR